MWEKILELFSSLQPETIKDTVIAVFSCAGGLLGALMGVVTEVMGSKETDQPIL